MYKDFMMFERDKMNKRVHNLIDKILAEYFHLLFLETDYYWDTNLQIVNDTFSNFISKS